MKRFFKDNYKSILKGLLSLVILIGICGLAYLILTLCGFSDLRKLRDMYGDSIWTWIIIAALQCFQVIFIPISNQLISIPACLIFNDKLPYVFLSSWIGILAGTLILYFIGKYGGPKLLGWILNDKDKVDRCKNFINRGQWFYPVGMMIGVIPDDILTTLAGTAKYNFFYVLVVSAITRAICTASTVWGYGYLTKFWWGWLILIGVGAATTAVAVVMFIKQKKKGQSNNGKKI